MQAADILVELVDRDGNVVTMPAFRRPTDDEWRSDQIAAIDMNDRADTAEIDWIEENEISIHRFCSVDRNRVTIHVAGTRETATCPNGHRWLRTFGENDGYREQEAHMRELGRIPREQRCGSGWHRLNQCGYPPCPCPPDCAVTLGHSHAFDGAGDAG